MQDTFLNVYLIEIVLGFHAFRSLDTWKWKFLRAKGVIYGLNKHTIRVDLNAWVRNRENNVLGFTVIEEVWEFICHLSF